MKKIRKILPVSCYDIPGLEAWLEEQAAMGLFPVFLDAWATFERRAVPGTRFRLDPFANRMGEGTEPTPEKLELYRQYGWEYALSIGQAYFLFYTTDPEAPELYTDRQSQGLSLERLTKSLRSYRRRRVIVFGIVILLLLATLFWPGRYDVQPAPLARLPLLLLELFYPATLFFFAAACFYEPIHRRDYRTLMATYHALKDGLPPPSPGPSKKIARENKVTLVMIPILLALLVFNFTYKSGKPCPLNELTSPYVSLSELETVSVYTPLDGQYLTAENRAARRFSLLAPVWYEVEQRAYGWEPGREHGFSPDPQDGRYTYAPSLDMTCFRLTLPILARPVAEAQLDYYRAVNLNWSYEQAEWPGIDFVILAKADDTVFQIAALCRGGRLAVFRYSGMEHLEDHLDLLSAVVQ